MSDKITLTKTFVGNLAEPFILQGDDFFGPGFLMTDPILKFETKDGGSYIRSIIDTFWDGLPKKPSQPGMTLFISVKAIETKLIPALQSQNLIVTVESNRSYRSYAYSRRYRWEAKLDVSDKRLGSSFILQDSILDIQRSLDNVKGQSIFDVNDLVVTISDLSVPFSKAVFCFANNYSNYFVSGVTLEALRTIASDFEKMIKITNAEGDIIIVKNENLSKKALLLKALAEDLIFKSLKRSLQIE